MSGLISSRTHRLGMMMLAAGLLCSLSSLPAAGMVINADTTAASNPSANTIAPLDDPGWANVGLFGGGGGVYLGNGWVITARHFSLANTITFDTGTFNRIAGTTVNLQNPDPSDGNPDLRMFRIDGNPGLPALSIIESSPTVGTALVMIGHGRIRVSELKDVTGTSPPGPPQPDRTGYEVSTSTRQKTWGTNNVSQLTALFEDDGGRVTHAFRSTFDDVEGNAQGTIGDSAGGAFIYNETLDQWELAGVLLAITSFTNQLDNTAAFGNQTIFADLSIYRDQIITIIPEPNTLGLLGVSLLILLRRRRRCG